MLKKRSSMVFTLALCISLTSIVSAQTANTKVKGNGEITQAELQIQLNSQKEMAKSKLAKIKQNKAFETISDDGSGNYTFTNAPGVDKATYIAELEGATGQGWSWQQTYYQEQWAYNNGTYIDGVTKLRAHNHDTISFYKGGVNTDDRIVWNGTSDTFFYGSNPFYADNIQQTEQFSCNCTTATSATFSWPIAAGATFAPTNKSASITWTPITTPNKYYSYNASYGNVQVDCWSIGSGTHSTTGNYLVGNTSYLATATNVQNF